MKVLTNVRGSVHCDPVRYFDFSKFENQTKTNFLLIEGLPQWKLVEQYRKQPLVYLNFEEPNGLFSKNNLSCHGFENSFYKVFTICPFTAKWLNTKFSSQVREPVYYPFNTDFIPQNKEKIYDVIYTGSIPSKFVQGIVDTISKFNYRFVSYLKTIKATNIDVTYEEKLDIVSKSKISVVHNLLFPKQNHILSARSIYADIGTHPTFKENLQLPEPIIPQLKCRVFESAFCKSLILCRRDPWNVIEKYFTPNEEFIYYEPNNLEKTIRQILNNYDSYKPIVEKAFERAINNYTTNHFFNQFLKDL